MHLEPGQTYIRKLSAVSQIRDLLAVEMGISRLLSGAELQPSGMSPAAILCVRSLCDPLPHTVRWRHRERGLMSTWEQAVRTALASQARQAARPARHAVPANAQAVLFNDRAELLACLAKDWCEGRIPSRWWWRSLFTGTDLNAGVLRSWREAPMYVPAALALLAEQNAAQSFVHALPSNESQPLLHSILAAFALTDLRQVFRAQTVGLGPWPSDLNSQATNHSRQPPTRPSWHQRIPEAFDPTLSLEQQCLLAIGLMVQRAPVVVRSRAFAVEVQHWINTLHPPVSTHSDGTPPYAPLRSSVEHGAVGQRTSAQEVNLQSAPHVFPENASGTTPRWASADSSFDTAMEHHSQKKTRQRQQDVTDETETVPAPTVGSINTASMFSRQERTAEKTLDDEERAANEAQVKESRPLPAPAEAFHLPSAEQDWFAPLRETQVIETAFAGVFYLVNLALYLKLYGDFTSPLRPGISLPLWDFVALVGRELVSSELETDPVWMLLAELAGRSDGEEPGAGFVPTQEVWEIIEDITIAIPLTQEQPENSATSLQHWLKRLMPCIRLRLQQALGLTADDDLAAILCHHHAHVITTATHVDVYLSLAALPIALRMAGLDRDPGWIPAAGRYLAFHFI